MLLDQLIKEFNLVTQGLLPVQFDSGSACFQNGSLVATVHLTEAGLVLEPEAVLLPANPAAATEQILSTLGYYATPEEIKEYERQQLAC